MTAYGGRKLKDLTGGNRSLRFVFINRYILGYFYG